MKKVYAPLNPDVITVLCQSHSLLFKLPSLSTLVLLKHIFGGFPRVVQCCTFIIYEKPSYISYCYIPVCDHTFNVSAAPMCH